MVTISASMEAPVRMTPASAVRGLEETTVCTPVGVHRWMDPNRTHCSITDSATHSKCACKILLFLSMQIVQTARKMEVSTLHS